MRESDNILTSLGNVIHHTIRFAQRGELDYSLLVLSSSCPCSRS